MTDVQPEERALTAKPSDPQAERKNRKPYHKPTKAEPIQLVSEVYKLLIIGLYRRDIIRYLSEKTTWELSDRTVDLYIAKATKEIAACAKFVREEQLGKALLRLNVLYVKTTKIQDYKTAIVALKELNELMGLYAPKRMELAPGDGPASFIAIMPPRPSSNEEWEQQCRQQQAIRPPTVIGSTPSGEA